MKRQKLSLGDTGKDKGFDPTDDKRQQLVVGSRGRSSVVQVEVRRRRGKAAQGAPSPEAAATPKPDSYQSARMKTLEAAVRENEKAAKLAEEQKARALELADKEAVKQPEPQISQTETQMQQPEPLPVEQATIVPDAGTEISQSGPKFAVPSVPESFTPAAPEPTGGVGKKRSSATKHTFKDEEPKKRSTLAPSEKKRGRSADLIRLAMVDEAEVETVSMPSKLHRPKRHDRKQKTVLVRVAVYEGMNVRELAERMSLKVSSVIDKLSQLGITAEPETKLTADNASLVAIECGFQPSEIKKRTLEEILAIPADPPQLPRPPIVTVMGHIDHGKTTLLEALHQVNIADEEFGGITQGIGAYQISKDQHKITMIDTPGHAAFTAMRSMGIQVTDIVILVVAANESIKQQTIEAIQLAKNADVPMVVAVSKCDHPDADPEKVYGELAEHGVFIEAMGGEVLCSEIVAPRGVGLDDLVHKVMLQAELLELKAPQACPARAVVLETSASSNFGASGTFIVQRGILKLRDNVVIGDQQLRIRVMIDEHGNKISKAYPSQPVQIAGLSGTPRVGELLYVVRNEEQARELIEYYNYSQQPKTISTEQPMETVELFEQQDKENKLKIIVKADKQGMLSAITDALEKIEHDKGNLQVVHVGVGQVTESDVELATAAGARILAFNVNANSRAKAKIRASAGAVEFFQYKLIYELLESCKKMLDEACLPSYVRQNAGVASIIKVFDIKKSKIAGCRLQSGQATVGMVAYLVRKDELVSRHRVISLRCQQTKLNNFKTKGEDFGVMMDGTVDFRTDDLIYFC